MAAPVEMVMPLMWQQTEKAGATDEEVVAVVQELHRRNVFHSQRTIQKQEQDIIAKAAEEVEEYKQKRASMLMWGGVGAGILLVTFIALR